MNSDLANIMEIWSIDTISMSNKYFGGVVSNAGDTGGRRRFKTVVLDRSEKGPRKDGEASCGMADAITKSLTYSGEAINILMRRHLGSGERQKLKRAV